MLRRALLFTLTAVGILASAPLRTLGGHEVPADVTVQAFIKPVEDVLRVLVRVPLTSMRDVEFPLFGLGYVDIPASTPLLPDLAAQWLSDYADFYEDDTLLDPLSVVAARISLPTDRSFETLERAAAHIGSAPLPGDTEIVLEQALLDVWMETPIASPQARFSIHAAWAHLGIRTTTVVRFQSAEVGERVFQYEGSPGVVQLDPRWTQAVLRFVRLGFGHILSGFDHLLFLLCLVIPFRNVAGLVRIVTAFTVAHSITLIAAVFGYAPDVLWFPPLIETLIALSIVFMAIENILGAGLNRRWVFAFGFGLIHGFGFSFLLSESMQYAGSHIVGSLLAFNVGVELGQLLVVLLLVPALDLLFKKAVPERAGGIVLSALVAHTAWHWMTERGGDLLQYRLAWPALDRAFMALSLRWLMLGLIIGLAWWGLHLGFQWLRKREERVAVTAG